MGGGYLSLKDTNIKPNELTKEKLSQENLVGVYIQNGEEYTRSDTIPDSGYMLNEEKSYCKIGDEVQDVTITYDGSTKMLSVSPITKEGTKCYLYFDEYHQLLIDAIKEAYQNNTTTLAYDETVDNNLRYIGANPNNYVLFNDELWRIIGIFDENTHGVAGTELVKIIRDESIGNYSWDNKSSYGSNDWSDSALQVVLNEGAYYNRTSGTCPSGQNEATKNCDFSETGLKKGTKEMIEEVIWKLGGSSTYTTVSEFYSYERGTDVYEGRPTEWRGKVGLMYASDYGYATSGGATTNRATCLATELSTWDSYSNCYNNDWLFNSSYQWTLTPRSSNSSGVFYVNNYGSLISGNAYRGNGVRPSVYLKSNISISSGDGSESNPYQLKL